MKMPRSVKRVPAVANAAKILRCVSRSRHPLTLTEIARATGIYPSTCLHTLWTLIEERLVMFEPATKVYAPALGLLELSQGSVRHMGLPEVARPHMQELASRHNISVLLMHRLSEEKLVIADHARSAAEFGHHVVVGAPMSAWRGAVGRVIAASSDLDVTELRKRFDGVVWQDPPPFEEWLESLAWTREHGFAVDRGNLYKGVFIAAAALCNPPAGCPLLLSSVGMIAQFAEPDLMRIARETRASAARIGEELRLLHPDWEKRW